MIYLEPGAQPSSDRQTLIGAYFTPEYSPESAVQFNPSIVPHPDQSGLPEGALRFILSLRATGEGHFSSFTFRVGTVTDMRARFRVIRSAFPLSTVGGTPHWRGPASQATIFRW